ncbi:MAG: flagellin [Candidatus Kapabacteria bacterium]|nr:flagellin [Candidatus Kapabacteria bacterium]
MPFASGMLSRIRSNVSAENAYNSLASASLDISQRQLRLSTGKRINNASDDVAGYITSKALISRNGSLKSAIKTVGDGKNVANISMDAYEGVNNLITLIKDSTASASSGALGTDEKVALAKAAYRMAQQIQTVVDSTVFGGRQLIDGTYSADYFIGTNNKSSLITLNIDLSFNNTDFDVSRKDFNINSLTTSNFGGVTNLDLKELNNITSEGLGIFASTAIGLTLFSLAEALNNVNKVGSYLGGISNRLDSQDSLLSIQITNYNAAISRLEDADVAQEQLSLVKSQFLQTASLTSLSQANQNPNGFLQLIRQ